jgi:hypothetical protein
VANKSDMMLCFYVVKVWKPKMQIVSFLSVISTCKREKLALEIVGKTLSWNLVHRLNTQTRGGQ